MYNRLSLSVICHIMLVGVGKHSTYSSVLLFIVSITTLVSLTVRLLSDIWSSNPQTQPKLGALRAEAWGPSSRPRSPPNSRSVSMFGVFASNSAAGKSLSLWSGRDGSYKLGTVLESLLNWLFCPNWVPIWQEKKLFFPLSPWKTVQ